MATSFRYYSSLSGANLVLDLSYNTEVSPSGHGDDILDAETSESIALTTITQETSYIQNSTLSCALHIDDESYSAT